MPGARVRLRAEDPLASNWIVRVTALAKDAKRAWVSWGSNQRANHGYEDLDEQGRSRLSHGARLPRRHHAVSSSSRRATASATTTAPCPPSGNDSAASRAASGATHCGRAERSGGAGRERARRCTGRARCAGGQPCRRAGGPHDGCA